MRCVRFWLLLSLSLIFYVPVEAAEHLPDLFLDLQQAPNFSCTGKPEKMPQKTVSKHFPEAEQGIGARYVFNGQKVVSVVGLEFSSPDSAEEFLKRRDPPNRKEMDNVYFAQSTASPESAIYFYADDGRGTFNQAAKITLTQVKGNSTLSKKKVNAQRIQLKTGKLTCLCFNAGHRSGRLHIAGSTKFTVILYIS